ncbi:MAG: D-2-hydroxyacid dehydrogenase [Mailhella sp.]|nr:D-2-hydroxyacid dehydrogenase [Mailhella sp.]
MKIVVLDGYSLELGNGSPWEPLSAFAEWECWERTPADKTVERSAGADILITNKVVIGEKELAQLPDVKLIAVTAAGTNIVDHEAAGKRGIPVCNTPAYGTDSVAQHVFALILELCRRTSLHHASVVDGEWNRRGDFCYWLKPQMELTGKTLGIFGFGNLGQRVAEIGHAFKMNVIACARRPMDKPGYEPFEFVSREELFRRSDVISLHCPLTDDTRGLVCAETLAMMKPGSLLINTARGPVVNSHDAAEALKSGHLAGFGVDVLEQEPPREDDPLLSAPNTIITPHIAWATDGARGNIVKITLANIDAWRRGEPQNVVNRAYLKQA